MRRTDLFQIFLAFLLASLVGIQSMSFTAFASLGDLNGDGVVDRMDLAIVAKAFGSYAGQPGWNAKADINEDSSVDMIDVTIVAIEYSVNSSSKLSSFGKHSANWSSEEEIQIYQGSLEPPDIFVTHIWHAPEMPTIHEKHPDKEILIYRNLRQVVKTRTQQWACEADWRIAEYEFARKNNIILKDSTGKDVRSKTWNYLLADVGNPKWQQFIADWIKFYIENYGCDGVFLDNGLSSTEVEIYWDAVTKPINPRTGTYFTDGEIIQSNIQVHRIIRETIGKDKLIICNGIYHGKRFFEKKQAYLKILNHNTIDGFTSEGIFGGTSFWDENKWQKSVEFIKWLQDNWLVKGKIFCPHVNWCMPKTPTDLKRVWVGFEDGYSLEHSVTFHLASILLGIEAEVSELNFFSMDGCWYKPFAEKLFSLDLGEPATDYHRIGDKHVYARKFKKGLVIVNPTTASYTISLDDNYRTLDGKVLSSLTIRRYQGLILLVM